MRKIIILSLSFFLLTTCKMEEDTVFITASVSDMSKGSTSFESGEQTGFKKSNHSLYIWA